jgi:hypothetical protein
VPVDGPDDTTTQDADAGQTDGPITVDASHDGGDASTGGEDAGILSGVVVDSQWQPVANALVAIPLGPSTLTDVQGTFTLAAPSGAYDLAVLSTTSSGVKHGYTFHGLTRHDPTLQLTADSVPFASSRIAGTVALASGATNGLLLIDPGASVVLQSDETITFTSTSVDYSGDAYWVGASNLTATAYQLQWSSTGGVYFTSAATPITLSNAGASALNVLPGTMEASGQIAPTITVSSGYTLNYTWLYWRPTGASLGAPLTRDTSGASTPFYATPQTGDTFAICSHQILNPGDAGAADAGATATPYGDACVSGLPSTSTPSVTLPSAPTLIAPPTSGVTVLTPFTWAASSAANVVYEVTFASAAAGAPQFYVLTGSTSAHLPDFSLAGTPLPAGATYTASVTAIGPFSDVDAATTTTGYYALSYDRLKNIGPTFDGVIANGGQAAFVTQ